METLYFPTQNGIMDFAEGTVYLRGDNTTVNQYCTDKGYSLESYTIENQRFSNDGALPYQYYGPFTGVIGPLGLTGTTTMWQTEFGFSRIVSELVIS